MIHPVLTMLFDLFIIGSGLAVASAMVAEYFLAREPHVGSVRTNARPATARRRPVRVARTPVGAVQRRRAA